MSHHVFSYFPITIKEIQRCLELTTTDLSLRNWFDPADSQVNSDRDDTDDPERLSVVRAQIPEDDSEDDTTEVARSSRDTRDDTVCERVNVGYKCEVGTVSSLKKECHPSDESEHG